MADEKNDVVETSEAEAASEAKTSSASEPALASEAPAADAPESGKQKSGTAAADGQASEPVEVVAPKERKRRSKVAKAAKAPVRAALTPEERHAERLAERRRKARDRRAGRVRARTKSRAARTGAETTPPREHQPRVQKTRQGVVVSDRAEKTITVRIDLARRHRRYEKIVRTSSTLHAHDERNDAHIGDTVIVRESRPLSRTKRWRLVEVVERAK
jgi:small subunit ribosomal protein S17